MGCLGFYWNIMILTLSILYLLTYFYLFKWKWFGIIEFYSVWLITFHRIFNLVDIQFKILCCLQNAFIIKELPMYSESGSKNWNFYPFCDSTHSIKWQYLAEHSEMYTQISRFFSVFLRNLFLRNTPSEPLKHPCLFKDTHIIKSFVKKSLWLHLSKRLESPVFIDRR